MAESEVRIAAPAVPGMVSPGRRPRAGASTAQTSEGVRGAAQPQRPRTDRKCRDIAAWSDDRERLVGLMHKFRITHWYWQGPPPRQATSNGIG